MQIHTGRMQENSFLGHDVDLAKLAEQTKNFSGAELEGLVKSATSFALNRQVDVTDLSRPIDEDNIKVRLESTLLHSSAACSGRELLHERSMFVQSLYSFLKLVFNYAHPPDMGKRQPAT